MVLGARARGGFRARGGARRSDGASGARGQSSDANVRTAKLRCRMQARRRGTEGAYGVGAGKHRAIDAVMAAAMQEAVRHTVRTEQSAAETPAHFRRTDVYIRGEALMDAVATVPALAALGKAWRR